MQKMALTQIFHLCILPLAALKVQTVDGGAVRIHWLLQAGHCQGSLNPHVGELVSDTNKHGLVNAIEEVIVNLGILRHATQ